MNFLKIYTKDYAGNIKFPINFPMVRDFKSLPLIFELITGKNYKLVDRITIVDKEGKENNFRISLYKKCFKENLLDGVKLADVIKVCPMFRKPKDLEIIRNNIVRSGYTRFCQQRYGKRDDGKITPVENKVKFMNITMTKKNGKVKVRYICAPNSHENKQMFRDLKTILEDMIKMEPEMLGLGKGVDKSMEYFNDFEALVKIDFKDFFNQVTYKKFIEGLKHSCPDLNEDLIKTLALTVCPYSEDKKRRATYQGLPTSTISAYIALLPLYKAIKERLAQEGIKPTIYIDDLCFEAKDKAHAFALKKEIIEIIKDYNFKVNFEKCKVLYGNKTFFLGINMRTKSLPKKRMLNIKAALNNYFHETSEEIRGIMKPKIVGQLNYVKMINKDQYLKLEQHNKYGNFLQELLG